MDVFLREQSLLEQQKRQAKIAKYRLMRVHLKRAQFLLQQHKRNQFYRELVKYVIVLSIILLTIITIPIHYPFAQTESLRDAIFDEEFPNLPYKKSYQDIMTSSEMWDWIDGPLLNGYYNLELRNHYRIGTLQLRTTRVHSVPCQQQPLLFPDIKCYPEYHASVEDQTSYGNPSFDSGFPHYVWKNTHQVLMRSLTFTPSIFNVVMDYGTGGYVVYLPRDNLETAQVILEDLKQDFLQNSTSYLAIRFALYNPSSNLFSVVQVLFEFSLTAFLEKSYAIRTFSIDPAESVAATIQGNQMMILFTIAAVATVYRFICDLKKHGLQYFQSVWNILQTLQLGLLVTISIYWAQHLSISYSLGKELQAKLVLNCNSADQAQNEQCFSKLDDIAGRIEQIKNLAGALALVSVMIIFKYLRLNARMNLLWRTLRFAFADLLAFTIIFLIVFIGYAIMGMLLYGSSVRVYHSLAGSLAACFHMLIGSFNYDEMYSANPKMTPVFFFSFMIAVYLIFVNMFIAILNEYYSIAQNEKNDHEKNQSQLLQAKETKAADATPPNLDDFTESWNFSNVEYDLWKQLTDYFRGLQLRVKFIAPAFHSATMTYQEKVVVRNQQLVFLVDAQYLQAERARLRAKFRASVRVLMICNRFLRPLSRFFYDFDSAYLTSAMISVNEKSDTLPLSCSNPYEPHVAAIYIPLASSSAKACELLDRLAPGSQLIIDDASLAKDQVFLKVLGDQTEYSKAQHRSSSRCGLTHSYNTDELTCSWHHIRCCEVIYDGPSTVLGGYEHCILNGWTWVKYWVAVVLSNWVVECLKFKWLFASRSYRPRVITDNDIEALINYNLSFCGQRGMSCRFDELIRNFRMIVAKKVNRHRNPTSGSNELEDIVFAEAVAFVERFPRAVVPLDKREVEGQKYVPQPVDTSRVRLPRSVIHLSEILSQNAHEVWSIGRINQGWKWGPSRDNDKKWHPNLVPYDMLTEEDKQYDRDTSMQALKVIQALGYVCEPVNVEMDAELSFGTEPAEQGQTYVPKAIDTSDITLPPELRNLVELLAENTHEVWAQMRLSQGWTYGPRRDDTLRTHNGLVPYMYLTPTEKEMDRNTAMEAVKVIIKAGFDIRNYRSRGGSNASPRTANRSRSTPKFRLFGRSEDPKAKTVGDAVFLASSTNHAKNLFLRSNSSRKYSPPSISEARNRSKSIAAPVAVSMVERKPLLAFPRSNSTGRLSNVKEDEKKS